MHQSICQMHHGATWLLSRFNGSTLQFAAGRIRRGGRFNDPLTNGATGMSDMAGKAARVAVEPNGSERDTMELTGSAT